jgi:DNA-binding MarR family transcriptional regulator
MQLLWAIVHELQKMSKRMAADFGVTGPQRLVLRVVGLLPGASPGTLARTLHVHPSTMTGILQRLTRQRLLTRSPHANDRRRSVLHLTAKGRRVNAAGRGTVESAVSAALRRIGPADAEITARALSVLGGRLQAAASPAQAGRRAVRRRAARPQA